MSTTTKYVKKLSFGLGQLQNKPPKWVMYITAIMAIIMASKGILIDQLPIASPEVKAVIGDWVNWLAGITGTISSILTLFLGREYVKEDDADTTAE